MKRWTGAEFIHVLDHYGVDRTVAQIAGDLRCSVHAVKQLVRDCELRRTNANEWTARQDARLRAAWGNVPTRQLAAELGRTPNATKQRAMRLGIASGRHWTATEEATLRQLYPTHTAADIATALGWPRQCAMHVYRKAYRLGLSKMPHHAPEIREQIRALHAEGLPDRVIAQRAGLSLDQVKHVRRVTLGLPTIPDVEAKRQAVRTQYARLGIKSGGELRQWAFRRYARECGWPEDLRVREVQVLNVLAARGVPMTRIELAEAIGMRTDRIGGNGSLDLLDSNSRGGTCTAALIRRGLALALKRAATVNGQGRGRSRDLYTLGPAALAILEERASCAMAKSEAP